MIISASSNAKSIILIIHRPFLDWECLFWNFEHILKKYYKIVLSSNLTVGETLGLKRMMEIFIHTFQIKDNRFNSINIPKNIILSF